MNDDEILAQALAAQGYQADRPVMDEVARYPAAPPPGPAPDLPMGPSLDRPPMPPPLAPPAAPTAPTSSGPSMARFGGVPLPVPSELRLLADMFRGAGQQPAQPGPVVTAPPMEFDLGPPEVTAPPMEFDLPRTQPPQQPQPTDDELLAALQYEKSVDRRPNEDVLGPLPARKIKVGRPMSPKSMGLSMEGAGGPTVTIGGVEYDKKETIPDTPFPMSDRDLAELEMDLVRDLGGGQLQAYGAGNADRVPFDLQRAAIHRENPLYEDELAGWDEVVRRQMGLPDR